ncbi:MAG: dihydrofolate reductase family protein [Sphingobacteriales bacterium JAD_PAG50586_3]|nr:MAG: dihydrofolate reductase family protein [Sphingobacteriales bacterium JAD_PAG50586_3]
MMRKLKLQVQMSIDGYVAGPNHEMDWMTWNWDDELKDFVDNLHKPIGTILLGRGMADGFITHWTNVANNPEDPSHDFAKLMVDTPKVVFTKTLEESTWANTVLAKGNLADEINQLKKQEGDNIIVYGGAGFNASLIAEGLIDELNLFVNPTAIGTGLKIFNGLTKLELVKATPFSCGIVVLTYKPIKA